MRNLMFFAVFSLGVVGCKNSNYCGGQNPDNNCSEVGDGGHGSADASEALDCVAMGCTDGKVCNTTSHACVDCIDNSTCSGTSPVCSAQDACTACSDYTDCPTTACDASGACALPSEISYVASLAAGGTVNNLCTQAMPCVSLNTALGLAPPIVRVKGVINELVAMSTGTKVVIGESTGSTRATLVSTTLVGSLITLTGAANLTIYNLDIKQAPGANSAGVYLQSGTPTVTVDRSVIEGSAGAGILASTGTVIVTRSTITGNLAGGLDLRSANFDIENSFIVQNGSGIAPVGGISVFQLGTGVHKIDFNTVAKNTGVGASNGVVCASVTTNITFTNNNVAENQGDPQVAGMDCAYNYSNISGATVMPGNGNRNDAPMFVDDVSAVGNFHLMAGSLLRDKADPGSVLKFDFDGNPRPQGTARDIGADELMP